MPDEITVFGWELHYTGPSATGKGSDKYYRVIVAGCAVVKTYGRRDTHGQIVIHQYRSPDEAHDAASVITNDKGDKGYLLTRDMTPFLMPADRMQPLTDLPQGRHDGDPSPPLCRDLIAAFLQAADHQGTASEGASSSWASATT